MDGFFNMYNLPKSIQDQISNLNRLIMLSEVETVIKSLPTDESPEPDEFSTEFYQIKTNSTLQIVHKIETEGTIPNSFYVTLTLVPKSYKDLTK